MVVRLLTHYPSWSIWLLRPQDPEFINANGANPNLEYIAWLTQRINSSIVSNDCTAWPDYGFEFGIKKPNHFLRCLWHSSPWAVIALTSHKSVQIDYQFILATKTFAITGAKSYSRPPYDGSWEILDNLKGETLEEAWGANGRGMITLRYEV